MISITLLAGFNLYFRLRSTRNWEYLLQGCLCQRSGKHRRGSHGILLSRCRVCPTYQTTQRSLKQMLIWTTKLLRSSSPLGYLCSHCSKKVSSVIYLWKCQALKWNVDWVRKLLQTTKVTIRKIDVLLRFFCSFKKMYHSLKYDRGPKYKLILHVCGMHHLLAPKFCSKFY
jgi:hypothetical protein